MTLRFSLIFMLLTCLELVACNSTSNESMQDTMFCDRTSGFRTGFSFSPSGFPTEITDVDLFFEDLESFAPSSMMWNGAWRDSLAESGTIPSAAIDLTTREDYCFLGFSVFGWRSGMTLFLDHPDDATNNWSNVSTREDYKSMAVDFAQTYKPTYMFLANENDSYYQYYTADYPNWLSLYNETYDAIKEVSPDTQVGVVFNYEHIAGKGTLNGWTSTYWEAYTDHDASKIDVVGLTTYPFLGHANATDIPDDYYDDLFVRIGNKPVAITEVGWPAEHPGGFAPLWNASETDQVNLIEKLETLLEGENIAMANWLFLHNLVDYCSGCDDWKLFSTVSLKTLSGAERPAFQAWKELSF